MDKAKHEVRLLTGSSRTARLAAARRLAAAAGTQLCHLDLARVVSQYIGETEKNLDRVFARAEASGAVLFLDEADALFGRRTEVKDAHDRYANLEVGYLLKRIAAHPGLVLLTCNQADCLDKAVVRRLRIGIA